MEILFLTASDQQNHPLHNYVDLHCNFDFAVWEDGFRAAWPTVHILDLYATFVLSGPVQLEDCIRNLVRRHQVKLLIVPSMYYELAPTFLAELRSMGCKSMIVFFDDSLRFVEVNRFYLNSFDYYLTHESVDSKGLYQPFGIEPGFFPNFPSITFYDKIIQKLDGSLLEHVSDVVFIGAKIADRALFVDYLKRNNINIDVFGRGWEGDFLQSEEMIGKFGASKICLNFIKAIDGSGRTQLKGRLFEIVMAGGFVLSEHCDELSEYFDIGREIDTFSSPEELLAKVKFYLEHEELRNEMLVRARERAEKSYSFEANWLRYLTSIKYGTISSQFPNHGYEVPPAAIRAFQAWNFSLVYGRCMLGQYGLARQQFAFCRRELEKLVPTTSLTWAFLKWVVRRVMIEMAQQVFSPDYISKISKGYS